MHEKQYHDLGVFLTLTYDNEHLPKNNVLDHSHFQGFMKRLRAAMQYQHKLENPDCTDYPKIKYFMCGEFGDKTNRPHYHAIILGVDFPDKKKHSQGKSGIWQYTSKKLDAMWGYGFVTIGSVTHESAGYTARYIMKKQQYQEIENAKKQSAKSPVPTASTLVRTVPYMACSKGFGQAWYEEYGEQAHARDSVICAKGKERKVPRYYDRLLQASDPEKLARIKEERKRRALEKVEDNTPERLAVREQVKLAQIKSLKRNL